MTNVNLLPYRIEDRRRRIAHTLYLAFVSINLLLFCSIVTYVHYSIEFSDAKSVYSHLRSENSKMSKLIGEVANIDKLRSEVESKLNLINLLQKGRYYTFSKLAFLSKSKPDKVWITYIKDDGNSIRIKGYAVSSEYVSSFMRNLESQSIFSSVNLRVVSNKKIGRFNSNVTFYDLIINQKYKDSDVEKSINNQIKNKIKKKHKKHSKAANKG